LIFPSARLQIASITLDRYIQKGQYRLQLGDLHDLPAGFTKVDIAISYMVMEHVEDDVGFIRKIAQYVKPGGSIILAVPGRRDRWSLEDETVGHFRRYDRDDLDAVLRKANLGQVSVWSVGVPTINMLSSSAFGWSRAAARLQRSDRARGSKLRPAESGIFPGRPYSRPGFESS